MFFYDCLLQIIIQSRQPSKKVPPFGTRAKNGKTLFGGLFGQILRTFSESSIKFRFSASLMCVLCHFQRISVAACSEIGTDLGTGRETSIILMSC